MQMCLAVISKAGRCCLCLKQPFIPQQHKVKCATCCLVSDDKSEGKLHAACRERPQASSYPCCCQGQQGGAWWDRWSGQWCGCMNPVWQVC
jgi:hypothetical protein